MYAINSNSTHIDSYPNNQLVVRVIRTILHLSFTQYTLQMRTKPKNLHRPTFDFHSFAYFMFLASSLVVSIALTFDKVNIQNTLELGYPYTWNLTLNVNAFILTLCNLGAV